ncbi:hypothetical protein H0H92_013864 [Tricholoma furcatifolium]|nr:hypothetical protein H0H92_013864 [Tricholoma furcatifolium]
MLGGAVKVDDAGKPTIADLSISSTQGPSTTTTTLLSSHFARGIVVTGYDGKLKTYEGSMGSNEDLSTSNTTVSPNIRKHNIATFAGAIGGSVGVLSLIALGLAVSIIKRRRRYERQERAASQSDVSPQMIGPLPFVPRFFPGTYVDPPSYAESLRASAPDVFLNEFPTTTAPSTTVAAQPTPASSQDASYANLPPFTPLPLPEAFGILPAPPPFGAEIFNDPVNPQIEVMPSLRGAMENALYSPEVQVQVQLTDESQMPDIAR